MGERLFCARNSLRFSAINSVLDTTFLTHQPRGRISIADNPSHHASPETIADNTSRKASD
jgi:hypothetical protein